MTAMNHHRNHQSIFNFALVMSFWSLAAMLFFPLGKTLLAMPPMPDQTDPAVCQGFTLPPSSPELDQILAAQQVISEAVFPAGGANYLYCEEGTWLLDEELNQTKEIHSDSDNPIPGVTNGGDAFLIYPFTVYDIDLTTLGLDPNVLQNAQNNHMVMSAGGGIIETIIGRVGYFGFYLGIDADDGSRIRMLIPYDTNGAFDGLYSYYFEQGVQFSRLPQAVQDCIWPFKNQYENLDIPLCNNTLNTCMANATTAAAGAIAVCLYGFVAPPLVGACIFGSLIGGFIGTSSCDINYYGCMQAAWIKFSFHRNNCITSGGVFSG